MTGYYIPEDQALHQHHRENIKSAHVRKCTHNITHCHIHSVTASRFKKKKPFHNLKTLTSTEKVYQTQPVFNFDQQLLFKTFFTRNKYYLASSAQGVGRNSCRSWWGINCCHPILSKPCNVAMCVCVIAILLLPCARPPPHQMQVDREKKIQGRDSMRMPYTTHQHLLRATQ
jgi:hypothetical protein